LDPSHRRAAPRARALRLAFGVASVAGIGLTPRAPGTAGAAFAAAIFVLLSLLPRGVGAAVLGLLCAAGFAAGVWAAEVLAAETGRKDDGRIVMDEFVGQLVTLSPLLGLPGWRAGADAAGLLPLVTGFVAFRVLDIWKPGPVGWAERRFSGGLGVMLDDLVAGLIGALALGAGMLALAGAAV
jgi:phosphatidylglycerophosphatase A